MAFLLPSLTPPGMAKDHKKYVFFRNSSLSSKGPNRILTYFRGSLSQFRVDHFYDEDSLAIKRPSEKLYCKNGSKLNWLWDPSKRWQNHDHDISTFVWTETRLRVLLVEGCCFWCPSTLQKTTTTRAKNSKICQRGIWKIFDLKKKLTSSAWVWSSWNLEPNWRRTTSGPLKRKVKGKGFLYICSSSSLYSSSFVMMINLVFLSQRLHCDIVSLLHWFTHLIIISS